MRRQLAAALAIAVVLLFRRIRAVIPDPSGLPRDARVESIEEGSEGSSGSQADEMIELGREGIVGCFVELTQCG